MNGASLSEQPAARDPLRAAAGTGRVPAAFRPLWRLVLRWYVRRFQRHRYNRLVLEWIDGSPLLVLPQVFNPRLLRTGELLARLLDERLVPEGSTVLDLGTGSGVGAVFAARWAGKVVAVDINPEAVRCARINALIHGLEDRIEVVHGDLFEPLGSSRFDVVLFNPPYYRGEPKDDLDMAWRSSTVLDRFATELRRHLAPRGHALVVLSTDGEQNAFLESFRASGLRADALRQFDLINEVVTVFQLHNATEGSDADPI